MNFSTEKKNKNARICRVASPVALFCAFVMIFGFFSAALGAILSGMPVSASEPGLYADGAKAVEYRGAKYVADEKGNVWEETDSTIRLVCSGKGIILLAVREASLYCLEKGSDGYAVSRLSVSDGSTEMVESLGKEQISSFSVSENGFYFMTEKAIKHARSGNIETLCLLEELSYECEDGHSHGKSDRASVSNASFFTLLDDEKLILHTENPDYVDESADRFEGIGENDRYISYLYDIKSGEITLYRENDVESSEISPMSTTGSIKVNGVTIPFAEYPAYSSYFTKNGRACSCHNANRCLNNAAPCNCLRYITYKGYSYDLAATQCYGFARYCQLRVYGYYDVNSSKFTNALGGKWSGGSFTASDIQNVFLENGAGGHIRTNSGHSLFVISVNATGFTTYECNTNNKDCLVYTREWTWASFYNYCKSKGLAYYKVANAYVNKVDVSYPTGDYLVDADGGLRLREKPTTSSSQLAMIPDGTILSISETVKIDGATVNAWWGKTTYGGKTGWVSLDYARLQSEIVGIKISKLPDRTVFTEGEKFSYDGLEVQLEYAGGTFGTLPGGYTVSPPDMSNPGVYKVKVSFSSFSATYEVTVESKLVMPTKIVFERPTVTVMTGGQYSPAPGVDYSVLPADAHDKTVQWSVVSGEHLVSVNKDTGVVTAVKSSASFVEGRAKIRATSLAKDESGKSSGIYAEYTLEVIKAPDNGEWSQPATNIPDEVSLSDYIVEYCSTASDFEKGKWKVYDGSSSVNAYRYRFRNAYKLTWYYDLDSSDGSIEIPATFKYPTSAGIGERVYIANLKAVASTNRLFAGWYTSADAARALDSKYAYKNDPINADTEFFAGWIDLSDEKYLINAAENDPIYDAGKNLLPFGVFESDINISDDNGGLRFYGLISSSIDKTLKSLSGRSIEYGMVVQLASKTADELRSSTANGYIQQGHSIVVTADVNYGKFEFMSGGSYTVFTTLATNIPLEDAHTDIAARAFVVYYDANGVRRAFYFTNTKDNTESLRLKACGVMSSLYENAVKLYPSATTEEKNWLLENVLGHDYQP